MCAEVINKKHKTMLPADQDGGSEVCLRAEKSKMHLINNCHKQYKLLFINL